MLKNTALARYLCSSLLLASASSYALVSDLSLSLNADKNTVSSNESLSYTFTVNNDGPDDASDVVLTITLPTQLNLLSSSGCAEDPAGLPSCSLGSLAVGSSQQITVLTSLKAAASAGIIEAKGSVSSANTDPDSPANATDPVYDSVDTASTMIETPINIIINEVDADNSGSDTLEFIELYDGGVGNTDLSGLALVFFNGSDDASYVPGGHANAIDLDGYSTDANGYFVLGNAGIAAADITFTDGSLQNGADAVALFMADASDFPNDSPVTHVNLIDALVYGTGDGDDSGLLDVLTPGQPQVDEHGAGDGTAHSNQRCDNGTGGALNTGNYIQALPTAGTENNCGHANNVIIIINEVDADTPSTDTLEFIELYDGGVGNTDLSGLALVFFNGSDDASYVPGGHANAIDLDGYSTDANGYFVLGNAGIAAADITFANNSLQNGADAVALFMADGSDFPEDTPVTNTNLIDALVYGTRDGDDNGLLDVLTPGQPQLDEHGASDGAAHSNQRCGNGTGGALNTANYIQALPTAGTANNCGLIDMNCGNPATLIHDIQGAGNTSPMQGQTVVIEAVLTGSFYQADELGGIYLQQLDADTDADENTSEGIFVSTDGEGLTLSEGDVVRLSGEVDEFFELTQISQITDLKVCSSGQSVTSTQLNFPLISLDRLEAVEGMQVEIPQKLVVSDLDSMRFNQVTLASEHIVAYTQKNSPDMAGFSQYQQQRALNQIVLGDGKRRSDATTISYLAPGLSAANTLRIGDSTDLNGIPMLMHYSFGKYHLQPLAPVDFSHDNARPQAPTLNSPLTIANVNVNQFFTTLNSGGANNATELTRQKDKIVSSLADLDADIVALIELENNADTAIKALVDALNLRLSANIYDYIDTAVIGSHSSRVALIYKPAKVTPVGAFQVLDENENTLFANGLSQPSLAQTFSENSSAEVFTVAVNDFVKRSSAICAGLGDIDLQDGQGLCPMTLTNTATALIDWLNTDPTQSGDSDFLLLGNLSAYAQEDAMQVFSATGFTNLMAAWLTGDEYTSVTAGVAGYADYALASSHLSHHIEAVKVWHSNADEPKLLDYNTESKTAAQQAVFYNNDAYRASDNNPIVVGINLQQSHDASPQYVLDLNLNGGSVLPLTLVGFIGLLLIRRHRKRSAY
ncbi:MAG: ExeM/NucH family extracellular endonuclease [Pseudomonadales bacterium]|nr:ExeM/NucH family extracellular endonuclease [Pseudomonadales bacterium]